METNKGFTLIEILVFVFIICILAAIAVPQYQLAVAKSRFSTVKELVKSIVSAQEAYYLANGDYTINAEDLDISLPKYNSKSVDTDRGFAVYSYDWGQIWLTNDMFGQDRAEAMGKIYLDKVGRSLTYVLGYAHKQKYKQKCVAEMIDRLPISSDISYKVCQQETGGTPGSWGGSSYSWDYE